VSDIDGNVTLFRVEANIQAVICPWPLAVSVGRGAADHHPGERQADA